MTNTYKEEIENFQTHMESALEEAWEEEDNGNSEPIEQLHKESIKISFKGQTLALAFGSTEYERLLECLDQIKEEL